MQQHSRVVGCHSGRLLNVHENERDRSGVQNSFKGSCNSRRKRKFLGRCFSCGKIGHTARRCFKRKGFRNKRSFGMQPCTRGVTGRYAKTVGLVCKAADLQCESCGSVDRTCLNSGCEPVCEISAEPSSSVSQLPDQLQDDFGLWDMLPNDECASVASAD